MRKPKKLIAVLVFLALIIGIPIIINEAYKTGKGYITVWGGSDVLAYYGALIGGIGTIVLGYVAWKQNERLLILEERSYLAENAGSALITEVKITGIGSTACNLDEHVEQVVATKKAIEAKHPLELGSISLTCKLEPMDTTQHIALVRVRSVMLMGSVDGKTLNSHIFADETDEKYSAVAISKEYDRFQITVMMSSEEKATFVTAINSPDSKISADIELSLLTDKYVNTELKCRAQLCNPDYDEKEKIYSLFKTTDEEPPMCFWKGTSLIKKDEVIIKTIKEQEDEDNG